MSKQTTETKTARPVHEVRLGLIKGAIWANTTRDVPRRKTPVALFHLDSHGFEYALANRNLVNEQWACSAGADISLKNPLKVQHPVIRNSLKHKH
ncbi:MAG: hypothetical protein DVB32_00850 [Verrucomicrobia bacterium]|nr:MAG: hypothetical protein DVB32_00850 [Verrucomicrobiota bacterium]